MAEKHNDAAPTQSTTPACLLNLVILLLLSGLLLFSNLHRGELSGYDDALYAHEGEQILLSGDWWNIHYNGEHNFEYPPLFFWLEASSMLVWGVTDFAAKFPVAMLGMLTICTVFFIGKSSDRNELYPFCAAWILMLTQYFLKYSMHVMTDVPYACFFTLAILFYIKGMRRPAFFLLSGTAIAGAILTRSILGFIPLAVIICHSLLVHRFRLFRSTRFVFGIILAVILPAIWYVSQYGLHGKPFLDQSLSVITSKLSSGGETELSSVPGNLIQYPVLLLRLYWPWLPFMIAGLWIEARKAIRYKDHYSILLIIWILFVLAPLSLAEMKILRYIMPIFPAFALLAAAPISEWLSRIRHKRYFLPAYIQLCLLITGIAILSDPIPRAAEIRSIGLAVESHVPTPERFVLYTHGERRHDYRNQFLWYSRRHLVFLLDPSELTQEMEHGGMRYFVVDRSSYEEIVVLSGAQTSKLSETDSWLFFKKNL